MATQKNFVEYILDQINDSSARARAMFGEYALYYDDKVVALICDDMVFTKITESSQEMLGDNEKRPAYPGAKDSYIITDEQIENKDFLKKLFRCIADDLPSKISKKLKYEKRTLTKRYVAKNTHTGEKAL